MVLRFSRLLELKNRPGFSDVTRACFYSLSADVLHLFMACAAMRADIRGDDLKTSFNTTGVQEESLELEDRRAAKREDLATDALDSRCSSEGLRLVDVSQA